MHATDFLVALTIVLGLAAITTFVFTRLRQPVVLGYILAGLILGPHIPIPVFADVKIVHTLSELGVIMLMFGLGLEFSLGKLFRAAPTAGITALVQCSAMMLIGFATAQAFGWTMLESIFCGAVIAISSTTIIAKAFDEQGVHGKLRELVVAILIVEDLIAVMLIAILTGASSGAGLSATEVLLVIGKLVGFLVALVVGGLFVVPRVMRAVVRLGRPETTVIAAIAICFGISLFAHEAGYSVALGAFVAGVLVAESGEARQIETLVHPVRDVFAAVFFVSVGIMIDPAMIVEHWAAVLVLSIVVIAGKIASVSVGAFLVGTGTRTSVAAGMSLAQIGEFSFIIAGVGMSLGAVGSHLYPIAVAVSAVTTLTTPWLIRGSTRTAQVIDAKLPKPLQTFVALYDGWIERLRAKRGTPSVVRSYVGWLVLDIVAAATLVIGVSMGFEYLTHWLVETLEIQRAAARVIVVAIAGTIAIPICAGILRTTRGLAKHLASAIVPSGAPNEVDLGMVPRRMLVASLQLAGVAVAGLPLVALTQPFLPRYAALIALGVALVILGVAFWRSARDLQGHVRALSRVVVEVLAAQSSADEAHAITGGVPALANWQRVVVPVNGRVVGRSLAELSVRGTTGATVLAIIHDGVGTLPDAHAPLEAGDVLAISGSQDAIAAATQLLVETAT
jgi:CPA2 family monovalent cation:H+ antiporter-2